MKTNYFEPLFNIFKPIPIYIKLYCNKVEVIRLDTGEEISRTATDKFSSERLVIADFMKAESFLRSILKELDRGFIKRSNATVIQQLEKTEGGLSMVEQRALKDLEEFSGASKVRILEHTRKFTVQEALEEIN